MINSNLSSKMKNNKKLFYTIMKNHSCNQNIKMLNMEKNETLKKTEAYFFHKKIIYLFFIKKYLFSSIYIIVHIYIIY